MAAATAQETVITTVLLLQAWVRASQRSRRVAALKCGCVFVCRASTEFVQLLLGVDSFSRHGSVESRTTPALEPTDAKNAFEVRCAHARRTAPFLFHVATCEYRRALAQLCHRSISNANLPSNSCSPMPREDAMWPVTCCRATQSSSARWARKPELKQGQPRTRHCNFKQPPANEVADIALQTSNVST